MLKTVGILMILAGSTGLGFSKSLDLSRRMKMLDMILMFTVLLRGEIQCHSASLPDAFWGMKGKMPGMFGGFLERAAKEMEGRDGASLGVIFERCARQELPTGWLEAEEERRFLAFGGRLGYLDRLMQMKQLELYELELRQAVERLRQEMPAKKKLYQNMGVLGGILLAVLVW